MELFRYHWLKRGLYLLCCLSLVLPLITHWNEKLWIYLNLAATEDIQQCRFVYVYTLDGKEELCAVDSDSKHIVFSHLSLQWHWDADLRKFFVHEFVNKEKTKVDSLSGELVLQNYLGGLSSKMAAAKKKFFGGGNIKIPFRSLPVLFVSEVLTPFNMFQVFSVVLWFNDGYWKYAIVILISMVLEVIMTVKDVYDSTKRIQQMVEWKATVEVMRDGAYQTLDTDELVPGDVIKIQSKIKVPADVLVLDGRCVVSEAMLTGESIPIIKESLKVEDPALDEGRNVVFYGSEILFTDSKKYNYATGLILTTNYLTVRGGLIRTILYPSELFTEIQSDSYKWVVMMFIIAILGFIGTLPSLILLDTSAYELVDKMLDLITVVVPPALPLALSIGISHSLHRLLKCEFAIYCTSPQKIIQAGLVDTIVFDKTGTLTEDKLLIDDVVPYRFDEKIGMDDSMNSSQVNVYPMNNEYNEENPMFRGMAACQALVLLDGEIFGDPLELELIRTTDFEIVDDKYEDNLFLCKVTRENNAKKSINRKSERTRANYKSKSNYNNQNLNQKRYSENVGENKQIKNYNYSANRSLVSTLEYSKDPYQNQNFNNIYIAKKFDFDSKIARMSVIAQDNMSPYKYRVYCKGSPEGIMNICRVESIPGDYLHQVSAHAKKGLRIIAMAYKNVNIKNYAEILRYNRQRAESDLIFCGFVLLKNHLKESTKSTIHTLEQADVISYMATGDHIQTALAVGQECGFVPTVNLNNVGMLKFNQESLEVEYPNKILRLADLTLQYADFEIKESRMHMFENCGIKFTYAMEGKTLKQLQAQYNEGSISQKVYLNLIKNCRIYARMSPDLKKILVQTLREEFHLTVGMCGDGANDCAALKESNVGLSLSNAEASIAAPFTTSVFEIKTFVKLLTEGRCALVTSFQCFKWMAMYSIVQFISVSSLYVLESNLSDNQFLWIDLFTILPLVYFMSWSGPSKKLCVEKPPKRLISVEIISSVLMQMVIALFVQLLAYYIVLGDHSYTNINTLMSERTAGHHYADDEIDNMRDVSFQTTAMFLVANWQYIFTNIIYSSGYPYREPLWKNYYLIGWCLFLAAVNFFINTYDYAPVYESLMNLIPISDTTRIYLAAAIAVNMLVSWFAEIKIVPFIKSYFVYKKEFSNQINSEIDICDDEEEDQYDSNY